MIMLVARRLKLGLHAYGPLGVDHDRRRFPDEALEEGVDGVIYLVLESMRKPLPRLLQRALRRTLGATLDLLRSGARSSK